MVTIKFSDRATEKQALGFLIGRFSGRVLRTGEHLVPEAALEALAERTFPSWSKAKPLILWVALLAAGCGRVSSLPIGTVVAEASRAADADHKPAQERNFAPQKPAAEQASPVNSSDPRITDVARDYSKLQSMTTDRVFVNPELAMLCRGASSQDVAEARKKHGPHAHTSIRVFMNDLAADAFRQTRVPFPIGSIIVKEKSGQWYDSGGSEVARESTHDGVGGMVKRSPGFDAAHGDWEYFYFEDASKIASGKISSCLGCHGGAASRDYVFGDWAKRH